MKKYKLLTVFSLVLFSLGQIPKVVLAEDVSNIQTEHRGGGIVLGDNGEIIEVLGDFENDLPEVMPMAQDSVYFEFGEWHWATFFEWNGDKTAQSNFNHYTLYHTATAQVGEVSRRVGAAKNQFARASVTGRGTAKVFYNY